MTTKGRFITHHELLNAIEELQKQQHEQLRDTRHELRDAIRELKQGQERLMALTQNEQTQLNRIAASIEAIATETAGTAQKILDLMAQHGVDQATIDNMSDEVTAALSTVADRAEALAHDLASPTTPLTPTTH